MILSIDTTAEFGSLALVHGERVVEEFLMHAPEGFSQTLFGHIQQILDRNGIGITDIECLAAAAGPGSFTGVRVCLTAAKGIAETLGRPIVAVSNLQALAAFGTSPLRAVLIDARRGEVYGAVYDSALEIVQAEIVDKFPQWLAGLPGGVEFIATDFSPFQALLPPYAKITEAPRELASAIGRIAAARYANGQADDPASIDANYVRRSDAELFWKDL